MTITIGIGRTYTEIQHVATSFQEALSALDYRFMLGKNKIISINDLESGKGMNLLSYNEWEKQLLSAMKTGKSSEVSHVLSDWFEDLKSAKLSMDKCYGSIHKLLVALMNLIVETGFDEAEVFAQDPFSRISAMKTLEEVKAWLAETCQRIIHYLSDKRTDAARNQMKLAETYIREQYHDENFALQHVCNHIYMSISYFSALFKQHTGETFVEYLTRIRLDKAKELLTVTQLKTYDIAARVGYSDPQYFSVIFKRITGMTPKEYRISKKGTASL
jgi:two-component system response regulator YesN